MKYRELHPREGQAMNLLKINKNDYRNLISNMMMGKNSKLKRQASLNSKFLIQPFYDTKKYLIVDITTGSPVLDKMQHQYTAPFRFYCYSGFIHLSTSLVVAGGYSQDNSVNLVNQVFDNRKTKSLPSMKSNR